jgi:heme O synthase-like polyprenyltransferase
VLLGRSGPLYLAGAVVLGLLFLTSAIGFLRHSSTARARRVLRVSLLYLPALLALLLLDGQLSTLRAPLSVAAAEPPTMNNEQLTINN